MSVFDELKARGLIAQTTHEDKIRELLEDEQVTFYIGFDPTADSLHVGHLLQMVIMAHMQRAGHRPIAVIGGGTAVVGDPTGRTDMRNMLTQEQIVHNGNCFVSQMSRGVDFSDGKAIMINNADWLLDLNYVDFLRTIGVHFSVNRMLTAECFKSRLEKGLSFIEFNYMLMQSFDFLKLYQDYGCVMQLGGDDQWSNIIGGIELIRRVEGKEAYGMTFALLTTSDGKKMGKTMSGAVWLDPNKTSPYDFYQYWRNTEDSSVIKCLKFLTFLPLDEIAAMESWEGAKLNEAKEILAYEVTKIAHGGEEADRARAAARAIFGGGDSAEDMPSTVISDADFAEDGIELAALMTLCGLTKSKGEARRLIEQGGVSVDDEKISDPKAVIARSAFDGNGFVVIKKGKKIFHKAVISSQ